MGEEGTPRFYPVPGVGHLVVLGPVEHILVGGRQGLLEVHEHGVGVPQGRKRVGRNPPVHGFVDGDDGRVD